LRCPARATRDSLLLVRGRVLTRIADAERRLVAIFAADVEGYSRLMGNDEVGTLRDLTERRQILDELIASHRGRIANTAGDSVLAEFGSAVDAVQCAVEAQAAWAKANDQVAQDRHIKFRIGVHVGDVMVRAGDLFGDGVNIAARLQSRADANGICISGVAHDQVRKILPLTFVDLGMQSLKNIEPIRAYAVSVAAQPSRSASMLDAQKPLALPDKPSIAVLPFQNMSGDPEQEYFADGMVEDITTALSRIKWLFVIARNSSFSYKGKEVDIKQVGRELGIRYVLEGSVRKAGNRVRITGQLINAENGMHIWADRFDGDLNDIFHLQDKVTESVISAISPKLQQLEYDRANRKPTANLTAYDYYLRGMSKFNQFKKETFAEALPLFRKALELDTSFASAYAAASGYHTVSLAFGWTTNRAQDVKAAISFARQALELEKDDAFVLAQAAWSLGLLARELESANDNLTRATTADANSAIAWAFRSMISVLLGKHEEAMEYGKRSLRLSPLDQSIFTSYNALAYAEFFSGRYDEALQWAEASVRANPLLLVSRRVLIAGLALSGRNEPAKKAAQSACQMDPTMRISNIRERFPLRRDEDLARLSEGFRLAGVPA
jgi:TolB-like protein/class 3 adenylate cyclase/Tfp pilus assembly protein PilF